VFCRIKKSCCIFGWDSTRAKGHGFGIAGGFEKGAYVATCAEVMVNDEKEVKVLRVTQAFDCGAIVNPHHLEQQVVGSIIQGLGGALFESVRFADGKILNSGLSAYRVPRSVMFQKLKFCWQMINTLHLPVLVRLQLLVLHQPFAMLSWMQPV
jgi:xanthine dehydrogenase molybdopterin-binding subunit B